MAATAGQVVQSPNELWSRFLQRARAGAAIEARIRCDAPSWRRLFDLRLTSPNGGFVVVTTHVVSEEPRAAVALLDAHWVEVEDLVSALRLMERESLPGVSHAICPECRGRFGADGAQG